MPRLPDPKPPDRADNAQHHQTDSEPKTTTPQRYPNALPTARNHQQSSQLGNHPVSPRRKTRRNRSDTVDVPQNALPDRQPLRRLRRPKIARLRTRPAGEAQKTSRIETILRRESHHRHRLLRRARSFPPRRQQMLRADRRRDRLQNRRFQRGDEQGDERQHSR